MPRARHRRPGAGTPPDSARSGCEQPQVSKTERVTWVVFLVAAVGALIWKHGNVFFFSWTDEQIHLYVARRVAEGAVLYRDIDSARPPLVLLPIAWLIRMGWAPLLAGRVMVVGSQLATAGLLLWGGWRLVSWRAGALAALLFLTSPEVFDRVHYTGIQSVALTAAGCVLFSLRAQPFRSGLFAGLTLVTGQHGIVVCGTIALITFVLRPRDSVRFAAGAVLVGVGVFGSVWLMGGQHVWESLVGHHLYHMGGSESSRAQFWERFTPWLYEHAYMFVGAGLALVLLRSSKRKEGEGAAWSSTPPQVARRLLLVVSAHLVVVLVMNEPIFLYVVLIAPLLALLAAIGFDATGRCGAGARGCPRPGLGAPGG